MTQDKDTKSSYKFASPDRSLNFLFAFTFI